MHQLTFRDGQFVLREGFKQKIISIKAAIRFRPCADKIAERVFNRTLVKHFPAPSFSPPTFLDAHQRAGVLWVLTRSRSYLAHAPGAGKTAQAVVAACMINSKGQTLFIVPPTLTAQWEREILKWTAWTHQWPSISIVPESPKQAAMSWRSDFIICPDSMLTKPWVYKALSELKLKLIAVDEASRFKEALAERTKALFGGYGKTQTFYGLVQNATHAVLLDGSPMPNGRPMELWAPVFAMSPEAIDFENQHEFGIKYCGGKFNAEGYKQAWEYRGATRLDEFRAKLRESFMHVVTEDELDHPERRRSLLFMNKDVRTHQMKAWEQKNLSKINLDEIDEDMSQGDLAEHRQQLGLLKVDFVVNYVRERLENKNESILIFAWHRAVCRAIANRLKSYRPGVVIGGTPNGERDGFFNDFQKGTRRLIVGNISAMGRGHNLQKADRVVFAEFSWTDELNKQCEKRASRKGSDKDFVRCDYIVAPLSLDEVVLNSVFTKAKNVKRVIG